MFKNILLSASLMAAVMAPAIHAESAETVTRRHSIKSDGIAALDIDAGVGSVRVEPGSTAHYELTVTIEPAKKGWFGKRADVSTSKVKIVRRGDRLELSLDPDSVDGGSLQGTWRVKLPIPAPAAVEVDLGVGEARIEAPTSAVRLDVGVGEAKVITRLDSAGQVSAAAGVGDASISGTEAARDRHVVGGQSSGQGEGEREVKVNVGVGEAGVTLTRE